MAVVLPIITEFNAKGIQAAEKSLKSLVKSQLGATVSAGALLELSRQSVKAALDDSKSQRLLAGTIRNTMGASNQFISSIEEQVSALQMSSLVTDDQLRPALQQLIGLTGDTTQAFDILRQAIDISAYSGRDLNGTVDILSRAYQGQMKGLRGLGLRISDATMKSKDFNRAMAEVAPVVKGANDAMNQGAEGAWKKVSIVAGEISESAGQMVIDLGSSVYSLGEIFNTISKGSDEGKKSGRGFFGSIGKWVGDAKDSLSAFAELFGKTSEQLKGNKVDWTSWTSLGIGGISQVSEADKKRNEAAAAGAEKARKKAAEANKKRLADAVKTSRDLLKSLRDEASAYSAAIATAIRETVSLSDAVNAATASDQSYSDALAERTAAYEELNAVQARGVDLRTGSRTAQDAADYAAALERVQKAEAGITSAQAGRVSYTDKFREQVAAAKDFAGSLQQLIGKGLQDIGLQQLLNLGPVAGAQVARDMLSGAAGLTVGDLNLTGLEAAATGLGAAASNMQYGGQLAAASATAKNVQYALTQDIKVVSNDPDAVVAALVKWAKKNGKLPSVVKVS